jgi:hypothetical protein
MVDNDSEKRFDIFYYLHNESEPDGRVFMRWEHRKN